MIKAITIIYSKILLDSIIIELLGVYFGLDKDILALKYLLLYNSIPILFLGLLIFLSIRKIQIQNMIFKILIIILSIIMSLYSLFVVLMVIAFIAISDYMDEHSLQSLMFLTNYINC